MASNTPMVVKAAIVCDDEDDTGTYEKDFTDYKLKNKKAIV